MIKNNQYDKKTSNYNHYQKMWNCNMGKKLGAIIMMLGMSVTMLTGCQLVEEEQVIKQVEEEEITNGDMLCGVFVSGEDLFWDEDLDLSEEDIEKALNGEEIEVYSPKVEGDRIYATRKEIEDENGGTYVDYVFEGCKGIVAGRYYVIGENGEISYGSSLGGEDNSAEDVKIAYCTTDDGKADSVTATVSINKEYVGAYQEQEDSLLIYLYYVYETREGEIYLTSGSFNIGFTSGSQTHSVSESTKIEQNGEEKVYSFSAEITFEDVMPTEKTILCQMNANNELIDTIEIDNGNIPETVEIHQDAQYVIVEEYIEDELISRRLVEMESENDYEEDEESEEELYIDLPIKEENELFLKKAEVELIKK